MFSCLTPPYRTISDESVKCARLQGIRLRQTAPEDVIVAIWLMPFDIPRRDYKGIINHPDSNRHIMSDVHRGFCTHTTLAVHYVNSSHFENDIRPRDGVMMCRQEHELVVEISMPAQEDTSASGRDLTLSFGDIELISLLLHVRKEHMQSAWWQSSFEGRDILVRLEYPRLSQDSSAMPEVESQEEPASTMQRFQPFKTTGGETAIFTANAVTPELSAGSYVIEATVLVQDIKTGSVDEFWGTPRWRRKLIVSPVDERGPQARAETGEL